MSELEGAAPKTRNNMKERTSEWMQCLCKMDEQIHEIKLAADCRIEALEKMSLMKLPNEQSLQYHGKRYHLKQVVALQSDMNALKRDYAKIYNA